jgi:hypothetical protein
MMVTVACETRHRRCGEPCSSSCHIVGRSPRRCHCRPAGGPVRQVGVGRYYDPATGQFLSVDPSVASTEQAYIYTNDNPVYMTDPQGTETVGPPGGGGSPYPQCGSPSTETYNIYEVCIQENEAGIVGTGHANWEDFLMGLGVAAGIVAIGSGIGILAGVEIAGLSVADLGTVSTVASLTAGLTEAPKCATGTGSS